MKRRILKILRIGLIILAELTVGAVAGVWVGAWAIPSAYKFRGYDGIGGEWVLILAASLIAMRVLYLLAFKKKSGGEKKDGKVQKVPPCIIH